MNYIYMSKKWQKVFKTTSRVFVLTASGTGGVEAVILNIVRPVIRS